MQSEFQDDDLSSECFVGASTSDQIQNSLELQIVNDLQETYRPRYKFDYFTAAAPTGRLCYVADRLGNRYVSLKVS